MIGPLFRRQMPPYCAYVAMNGSIWRCWYGKNGVVPKNAASSSSEAKHRMGAEAPTPRGSNPTTSKRASTSGVQIVCAAPSLTSSTPEPPGPPGFTNSEPMRRAGSLAGRRISASEMVGPPGSSWSSGTRAVAHSYGAPQPVQRSTGTARAAGRGLGRHHRHPGRQQRRGTPPPASRLRLRAPHRSDHPTPRASTCVRPHGPDPDQPETPQRGPGEGGRIARRAATWAEEAGCVKGRNAGAHAVPTGGR